MKVICDGLDLSDAVLKVSKALPVKAANPVLEGIKITATGNTLTLLASDMEISIKKTIKADVLMEGETVVVGKYFVELIKKLEKEQVELSRLYDGQLEIKYSDSKSEFQVFPVESYPKIEQEEKGNFFVLTQGEFKSIIEKTCFACAVEDSRPILKGCLYEVNNGKLTTVSLDGFRMSVVKKDVLSSGDFSVIIPSRTLQEISRLLDQPEKEIKIYIHNNSLFIEVENTVLISRLIEGEFVKYSHILPTTFENTVTVNKEKLLNSIDRASIIAKNDKFNIVKFDIKENKMSVTSKSEVGEVKENIDINLRGKDISIAFNGKYILDYFKIVGEEFVNINLNSPIDPCILTTVGNEEFIYLVLPVRINS